MKKILDYIDSNTKNIAIFCAGAALFASFFFLYYFNKFDWALNVIYLIPACVYYGIINSNYKTRKQ